MFLRLTRIEVAGFRSLRDVVLRPQPLEVLLDPDGTATRDLIRLFTLLRALAEGRLQEHLTDVADGPVTCVLGVQGDDYRVELRRFPDGRWRITREELDLVAGLGIPFIDPSHDAPRDEARLSTFPPALPEHVPGPVTGEAEWLGQIADGAARRMNRFLRGFRVQPAGAFTVDEESLLFLQEPGTEPEGDLPANALWDRVQSARAASSRVPVLLCTPSVALADAFDLQDVQRVETTSDGASSFRPLGARKESGG
ncbi:hypothetical protein [Corallococcus llansteffanensis]|uniref:Uncharacterized protein n=1 Tax=Corallococcus llansteffanensis TaxID=2316731 RepID=A0A3A8PVY5_9BACT|nr:hypothetical protein [Corallococcus llansteffanensis]RKH60148.1 hypothetical protein D7V93_13710 [Corallococcus llansteffanensis]